MTQTELPYSMTGCTSPLYVDCLTSNGHVAKLRLRKERVLLAFVKVLLTCAFHFKLKKKLKKKMKNIVVTLLPYLSLPVSDMEVIPWDQFNDAAEKLFHFSSNKIYFAKFLIKFTVFTYKHIA